MVLGLALVLAALLWARDIRRKARGMPTSFRGPWTMGIIGVLGFLFYLWLVSHGAFLA